MSVYKSNEENFIALGCMFYVLPMIINLIFAIYLLCEKYKEDKSNMIRYAAIPPQFTWKNIMYLIGVSFIPLANAFSCIGSGMDVFESLDNYISNIKALNKSLVRIKSPTDNSITAKEK